MTGAGFGHYAQEPPSPPLPANLLSLRSRKPLCGMIAINLLIAHILAKHFQRFVAAMLLHLEQICALTPRLGQEPGAQAMSGKHRRVIARGRCARFDDKRYGLSADPLFGQPAVRCQAAEYWSRLDSGVGEPCLIVPHWLHPASIEDGDRLPPALLVGFRGWNTNDQPAGCCLDVRDIDSDELGAPECSHHAEAEQGAIAVSISSIRRWRSGLTVIAGTRIVIVRLLLMEPSMLCLLLAALNPRAALVLSPQSSRTHPPAQRVRVFHHRRAFEVPCPLS
jgi:hypothetical protein